jgi:uroporphyrinogen decarboxylase
MNERDRFLAALTFGTPDRVPLEPGWPRKSTREAWHAQGLPRSVGPDAVLEHAYREAGGRLPWPEGERWFPVNERMIPQFEEKVLERGTRTQIVQDWKGNVCEISNEFTPAYLREAIDFVTRRWIRCPVETRADWEAMKARYRADDPSRVGPFDPAGDRPLLVNFSGPFWQLREWLGFEPLCMLLIEDPSLAADMISFWSDHVAGLLERACRIAVPDMVRISEDMAFKGHAMISPAMARTFLLPVWRRWGRIARDCGCPLYCVDSDGLTDELIPVWIEAGINVCEPMEVAAGNDVPALRRRFGRAMAFRGGVDKRAMARGGCAIEDELKRLDPVIRDGGYVPGCDHGVPPDVSWPDFVRYTGLLAKATGWLQAKPV